MSTLIIVRGLAGFRSLATQSVAQETAGPSIRYIATVSLAVLAMYRMALTFWTGTAFWVIVLGASTDAL